MRILIAVPALLVLGACNVSKEGNAVTVQYDQNTAADIGNDVQKTGDKIQNTDVNVKVGNDEHTNTTTTTKTTTEKKSK